MQFSDFRSFNKYLGVIAPKSEQIDVGMYQRETDFRLSSEPVFPNFYRISLKFGLEMEKEVGFMYFSSPNQPIEWKTDTPWDGYYINLHADLISNNQYLDYSFLNYGLHEALRLKEDEQKQVAALYEQIYAEYQKDHFSVQLLIAYCNLLFTHIAQFYQRQFGEEKEHYHRLIKGFKQELKSYYNAENQVNQPSVAAFASRLNITPNYLSDVLKHHTGKPALEHIHTFVVDKAKELLTDKKKTVGQIAFQLGFEYPNYFARLFKKETGLSPSQFRNQ